MVPRVVDVNVLVALMHARHVHCGVAAAWMNQQEQAGSVGICRVVQMGVLRLLTRSSLMKDDVLTAEDFWRGWDRMLRDDRWVWVGEPEGLEAAWRQVTRGLVKGQCAETDTYLAGLVQAMDATLVTFDRGFRRFPGLRLELLAHSPQTG